MSNYNLPGIIELKDINCLRSLQVTTQPVVTKEEVVEQPTSSNELLTTTGPVSPEDKETPEEETKEVEQNETLLTAVFVLNPIVREATPVVVAGPHSEAVQAPVIEEAPYALALADENTAHLRLLNAEEVLPLVDNRKKVVVPVDETEVNPDGTPESTEEEAKEGQDKPVTNGNRKTRNQFAFSPTNNEQDVKTSEGQ